MDIASESPPTLYFFAFPTVEHATISEKGCPKDEYRVVYISSCVYLVSNRTPLLSGCE